MSEPDAQQDVASLTHAEVVDAVLRTLEMLISHAAQMVEQKTQLLTEHIAASSLASGEVTAMQFQDYNSQLAENALRLVALLRQNGRDGDGEELLATCHEALTLGEIRDLLHRNLNGGDEPQGNNTLERGTIELF